MQSTMNISCPGCHAVFKVKAKHIGRKAKCPKCSSTLIVQNGNESGQKETLPEQAKKPDTSPKVQETRTTDSKPEVASFLGIVTLCIFQRTEAAHRITCHVQPVRIHRKGTNKLGEKFLGVVCRPSGAPTTARQLRGDEDRRKLTLCFVDQANSLRGGNMTRIIGSPTAC